ncbi:hypothetical protein APHAL10511_001543 [Amanita phalloides]|nr:hypothetical protein APHAL10511_001543 [Amanita phalloides]
MFEFDDEIQTGDVVAVTNGLGRVEGLVIGSHVDYLDRQIIQVQLEREVYHAWRPTVTRVKRTVRTTMSPVSPLRTRTIERKIYW